MLSFLPALDGFAAFCTAMEKDKECHSQPRLQDLGSDALSLRSLLPWLVSLTCTSLAAPQIWQMAESIWADN